MATALRRDKCGVRAEGPGGRDAVSVGLGEPTALEQGSAATVKACDLWLGPGMVVADYAVVSQVSDSPVLQTFEAVRRGTGRTVALQVLGPMRRETQGLPEAWVAWGDAIRKVHHPGLVECDCVGVTSDGLAYAVFEWLDGITLRCRLESMHLGQSDALAVLIGVLEGLDVVHQGGLVHGDVRPENVFCTSDGSVKLLGLGLSECLRACQSASDGSLFASAAYVSPEQIAGAPATVQSDLYAFGMLAHECLLGRHPLVSDGHWPSTSEMLLLQAQQVPEPLVSLPAPVRLVVESTIAKSPKRRPTSARQVLAALRALRAGQAGVLTAGGAGRAERVLGDGAPVSRREGQSGRGRVVLALPSAGARLRGGANEEWGSGRAGVSHRIAAVRRRSLLRLPAAAQANRRAHQTIRSVWLRWPYGHMVVGGVLGVLAGISVYLWQTHRSAASVDASSGAQDVSSARRGGSM